MIKSLAVAIWAAIVIFAASYGASAWLKSRSPAPALVEKAAGSETRKTKEINVPVIRKGAVMGYVVLQLNYVVDLAVEKGLPVQPDAFVVDEAFRYIYNDSDIDFTHLDKIELEKLTSALMFKVNTRMKAQVLTDMGVQECNFLLNSEAISGSKQHVEASP